MKNKRKMLLVGLVVLTVATPAFAWMDGWQGYYGDNRPKLNAEQQQQVQAVEKRYTEELKGLEAELHTKQTALIKARAEGSTTMAEYNALQTELGALENSYRAKIGQANQEIWQVTGNGTAAWFVCDYQGCDHNRGRRGMMNRRMMDDGMMNGRGMQASQNRSCCW